MIPNNAVSGDTAFVVWHLHLKYPTFPMLFLEMIGQFLALNSAAKRLATIGGSLVPLAESSYLLHPVYSRITRPTTQAMMDTTEDNALRSRGQLCIWITSGIVITCIANDWRASW